jgi:hypothetical protein
MNEKPAQIHNVSYANNLSNSPLDRLVSFCGRRLAAFLPSHRLKLTESRSNEFRQHRTRAKLRRELPPLCALIIGRDQKKHDTPFRQIALHYAPV